MHNRSRFVHTLFVKTVEIISKQLKRFVGSVKPKLADASAPMAAKLPIPLMLPQHTYIEEKASISYIIHTVVQKFIDKQ